jgi:hypothetical protein
MLLRLSRMLGIKKLPSGPPRAPPQISSLFSPAPRQASVLFTPLLKVLSSNLSDMNAEDKFAIHEACREGQSTILNARPA